MEFSAQIGKKIRDLTLIYFTYGLKGFWLRNVKKMGKKETWFSSVKKALSPDPKEKRDQVWDFSEYVYEFL